MSAILFVQAQFCRSCQSFLITLFCTQFHRFALNFTFLHLWNCTVHWFGINWHVLSQSECRNCCLYIIRKEIQRAAVDLSVSWHQHDIGILMIIFHKNSAHQNASTAVLLLLSLCLFEFLVYFGFDQAVLFFRVPCSFILVVNKRLPSRRIYQCRYFFCKKSTKNTHTHTKKKKTLWHICAYYLWHIRA